MKKLLVLATLLTAASAFSQGTVVFNNRVPTATPPIVGRVSYGVVASDTDPATQPPVATGAFFDGTLRPSAQAGLYGGAAGTAEDALVLLTPAVGFRSGATLAGYIVPGTDATRAIQGVQPGSAAVLQMRAWDAGTILTDNSYEGAVANAAAGRGTYYGRSVLMTLTLGGTPLNGDPPITPPNLVGLVPFAADYHLVPEPSIIGLGLLGGLAGLLVFRRRN